jgi:hypothetical protein
MRPDSESTETLPQRQGFFCSKSLPRVQASRAPSSRLTPVARVGDHNLHRQGLKHQWKTNQKD